LLVQHSDAPPMKLALADDYQRMINIRGRPGLQAG
jgi:hypothetical protein